MDNTLIITIYIIFACIFIIILNNSRYKEKLSDQKQKFLKLIEIKRKQTIKNKIK